MRIGFFSETYYPKRCGVLTSMNTFGEELVKRGHEVYLFTHRTDREEHLGIKIITAPYINFKPYPEQKLPIPIGMKKKTPKLDIVHTHTPILMGRYGLKVAKRQKIPSVTTHHTAFADPMFVSYISKRGLKYTTKIADRIMQAFFKKHDKIICPSQIMKSQLKPVLQKKSVIIPTGINTNYLHPIKNARKKLSFQKYEKIYLNLGRLGFEKDIDIIIRGAVNFLGKNDRLVICGKGPALEMLKKLAKELKIADKVIFPGYVSDELKPVYYSAADAYITASGSETQGIVVSEAHACGTPVIGADRLAVPEFIREGIDGYLFNFKDPKSLARVVKYSKFPKTMRINARKHALEMSTEKMTDKLEAVYKSLVPKSRW